MFNLITKTWIADQLQHLREQIESDIGLSEEQALLLADICDVLDLGGSETARVLGKSVSSFIEMPIACIVVVA